jgi:ribosomal protein S16
MMRKRQLMGVLGIVAVIAGWHGVGLCDPAAVPRKGSLMPAMNFTAPASQKDCDYLGVETQRPFQLADVHSDLVMIEILGVYCPQCHKQRPHINRLYHRIQKDAALSKKVKLVGIAVGATAMEAAYLVKESHIPYPVITDLSFDVHKRLGEPRTPFNILTTRDGKVLWTHLGVIEDMNTFYTTLRSMAGL